MHRKPLFLQLLFTVKQGMDYYRLVKPALFILLLIFIFSLWQRVPDIDDAWIGEHAYWQAENGYVKSELMHGITGQEVRHIVHHKFFTLNGLIFIKVFGFSLYTIKSVSLLWVIFFFVLVFFYIRKKMDNMAAWFAMLFLGINAFIFQYSFVYRPEIVVMTLGFISFIYIERYLDNNKARYIFIAGFTAGLAAATHLNGLIFIGAGSLTLMWQRKPYAAFLMALASLPGLAVYFYDFSEQYNISYWLYQVNDSPALHKSPVMPSSVVYLMKILREHLRFLHSPKEIVMTILLVFCIVMNYKDLKSKTIYLQYLLLLVILLALISVHSTSKYLLLYLPVITLIIIRSMRNIKVNNDFEPPGYLSFLNQRRALGMILLLYFGIHLTYNILISVKKYNPEDNARITEKYFSRQTDELNILAPMEFIFNEIPKYGRIQSDLSISEMQKFQSVRGTVFFDMADSLHINAMILSDEYIGKFGLKEMNDQNFRSEGFRLLARDSGYTYLIKE
jgi:4-amino-4-deoxy-L-arabinose transferase-like glycosyltransferase